MIRTKEFKVAPELRQSWEDAIRPIAEELLADSRSWPLLERVGEKWLEAPPRCVRVGSLALAGKALVSKETDQLWEAANPGLRAMYFTVSDVLNERQQHFVAVWKRLVERSVGKATTAALETLLKRLKWKPGKRERDYCQYRPNRCIREYAWERLHPDAVEAPFNEHFLTVLRAGHLPAGLAGTHWKNCRFLYF
jgi:hypothetical protein